MAAPLPPAPPRPLPAPNPGTAQYWKATREHRLEWPRCLDCGKRHSYPRTLCPACGSERLTWEACSGRGTVYSYTEVLRAPSRAFAADVPYIIAVIELEEGPHMMSRLVGVNAAAVRVGMPVLVDFEDMNGDISLPVFRAAHP